MILVYLFIGIIAAILSALPLGASNIAVINTTLKENAKQAFKIAITAGIAEVLLSYYALDCNKAITLFFDDNLWVQTTVVLLLFTAGSYLFFKKQTNKTAKKSKLAQSKYATGFLLGIINPPVLIYWVIAFGVLNNNDFMLSLQSSILVLFLFFAGVYIGKLVTLYAYSKMSVIIKHKVTNITQTLNRVTGVLLIIIGLIQSTQLYLL
ncbi:LysE family transporter [Hyunsoonleella sp. 2307UL5-6]|uniref:LysE family transporter n=1 Tax=Hyunsoonleella sp. 2307UL5-6 TaxID=3384768 RepID=UPI0039BD1CB4